MADASSGDAAQAKELYQALYAEELQKNGGDQGAAAASALVRLRRGSSGPLSTAFPEGGDPTTEDSASPAAAAAPVHLVLQPQAPEPAAAAPPPGNTLGGGGSAEDAAAHRERRLQALEAAQQKAHSAKNATATAGKFTQKSCGALGYPGATPQSSSTPAALASVSPPADAADSSSPHPTSGGPTISGGIIRAPARPSADPDDGDVVMRVEPSAASASPPPETTAAEEALEAAASGDPDAELAMALAMSMQEKAPSAAADAEEGEVIAVSASSSASPTGASEVPVSPTAAATTAATPEVNPEVLRALASRLQAGEEVDPKVLQASLREAADIIERLGNTAGHFAQVLQLVQMVIGRGMAGVGEQNQGDLLRGMLSPTNSQKEEAPRSFLLKRGDRPDEDPRQQDPGTPNSASVALQRQISGSGTASSAASGAPALSREDMDKQRRARAERLQEQQRAAAEERKEADKKSKSREAMFDSSSVGPAKPLGKH